MVYAKWYKFTFGNAPVCILLQHPSILTSCVRPTAENPPQADSDTNPDLNVGTIFLAFRSPYAIPVSFLPSDEM